MAAEMPACANLDRCLHSASYSDRRLGSGYGVNAASIMRRLLARSPSFGGGRTLQVTSCESAHAARTAVA